MCIRDSFQPVDIISLPNPQTGHHDSSRSCKIASAMVKSTGVVILRFSGSPSVRKTCFPMRSTAEQSSVSSAPDWRADWLSLIHISIPDVRVTVAASPLFRQEEALSAFERAISSDVDVVICNHVSNVFGCVLPLEGIAALCRSRNVPLIVDASQSAGVLPLDLMSLQAAFIAMPVP